MSDNETNKVWQKRNKQALMYEQRRDQTHTCWRKLTDNHKVGLNSETPQTEILPQALDFFLIPQSSGQWQGELRHHGELELALESILLMYLY